MIKLYFNSKMLKMLCFGFASGFPALLIFSTLGLWLKDAGISLAIIGAFALVKLPYAFKWLFSPFIDNVKLPVLYKLGRRRSWALFLQVLLLSSILLMCLFSPNENMVLFAIFCCFAALFSACLDVVLDAYRVESFEDEEQGNGAAVFVLGYRLGYVLSGAGALALATSLSWNVVYALFACLVFVGIAATLLSKEPNIKIKSIKKKSFFIRSLVLPIKDFFIRKNAWLILLFVAIYRMPETYVQTMILPFLDDVGFLKSQIASIYNIYGVIATIIGGFLGGYFILKSGVYKSLIVLGVLQGVTNILYVYQNYVGADVKTLITCVSFDNIISGMGTTAFIAYLSSLCNKQFTATQYALLTSLFAISRDVFSSFSGVFVDCYNWNIFFLFSAFMALPGILLIAYIYKQEKSS